MKIKAAQTYVSITREEFEDWLDDTFSGKWKLKQGTKGIYIAELTENVGIEIASSIGSDNEGLARGNASMQMRLISLKYPIILNKKAQGQSHFKRTSGWRLTLKKAVESFRSAYLKNATFYEALALIPDRDEYKHEKIKKIESIQNWQQNNYLVTLHKKMEDNGILMKNEEEALDKLIKEYEEQKNNPKQEVDEAFLEKLRSLYRAAKSSGNQWLVDFVTSVGQLYKKGGKLSQRQMDVIELNLKKHKIASNVKKEVRKLLIAFSRLIASKNVKADDKEWTEQEWKTYKEQHPDTQIHPKIKKDEGGAAENKPETQQQALPVPKETQQKKEINIQKPAYTKQPSTHHPTRQFFTEDEMKLPKKKAQPHNTKAALYESAKHANNEFKNIFNNGGEFEKALGLTHYPPGTYNPDHLGDEVLGKKGPILLTAPLKGEKRATEKVMSDYNGDWSQITDVVRGTIAVDNYHDIDTVVKKMKEAGVKVAAKPKDRFSSPTDVGYRDVMLSVELPSGHVAEMQVNVKPMLAAKEKAHKEYEDMRSIEAKMKNEGREIMTPEEENIYRTAADKSLDMYNAAWDVANGGKGVGASARVRLTKRMKTAEKHETILYYETKDGIAYRKPHSLPVKILPNGAVRVVYDSFHFDHDATQITLQQFNQLRKEMGV